jgi:prevent-host-death family protein
MMSYRVKSEVSEAIMRVSTLDFIKHFSALADRAVTGPVTITKYGRDRLVVLAAAEYESLRKRDRQVFQSADLPAQVLERIAQAEVSAESAYLDGELKDWNP